MPAKPQTAKPPAPPKQKQPELTISEIDLSQVPVADLVKLKEQVDFLLSKDAHNIGDNDLVLEYTVKLRTKNGVVSDNEGVHRLNAILHPRLLSDAPSRFETAFMQNIFAPVNADAYDLFDSSTNTNNPLSYIRSQTAGIANMPQHSLSMVGLPGE